jgi:hypothetical protein
MEKPTQQYQELVAQGTAGLIHAFSLCVDEIFRAPLVITREPENPFADLPVHVKSAIIQSAATQLLAQCLASMAMIAGQSGVEEKQVMAMGTNVLKHEFSRYLKSMRKLSNEHENTVGKGPESGNDGAGLILDPGAKGS